MTNEKVLKAAEREKDIADVKEAAVLAETAAKNLTEAEQVVRAEGSAYSLARFAYQVSKSGLGTEKLFTEVRQKVEGLDHIPKQDSDTDERAMDWALGDIAVWQYLSGYQEDTVVTIGKISDTIVKASTYARLARKLKERNVDGAKYLALAEKEVDQVTDIKKREREGRYLAGIWARYGNRIEVERLVKKYSPDDLNEQEERLVDYSLDLLNQGVKVDDILLTAFRNEEHPVEDYYRSDLVAGLIQTGHLNEALVLLLEQPGGDTPELTDAWTILSQAQTEENHDAALAAWKVIASVAELDFKAVGRAGVELAKLGDEPSAQAMITLLDKLEEKSSSGSDWEKKRIQDSKNTILLNLALQFIEKRRTEIEKGKLVTERFHKPLAEGVKELMLQIPDISMRVDGLRALARKMAERGNNPNMFRIVDEIETLFKKHTDLFDESTILETFLELAELSAKGIGTRDGNMTIPESYIGKATDYLKSIKAFPPTLTDYSAERLWVTQTRVAAAAIQAARARLSRGSKTKTKTSTQLNKLPLSDQGRKLIENIRPE